VNSLYTLVATVGYGSSAWFEVDVRGSEQFEVMSFAGSKVQGRRLSWFVYLQLLGFWQYAVSSCRNRSAAVFFWAFDGRLGGVNKNNLELHVTFQ
jgi:hypothetical protein